jgi:type IV pilus assembly protein PilV
MRPAHAKSEGDSLIEVMIALSITAIAALGLVATQTWLARSERALLTSERATLIADSVAEAIQGDADRSPVISQWRTRAASMLPQGDVAVLDQADGVRVAVVSWHADEKADACPEPQAKANSACVALAFAR